MKTTLAAAVLMIIMNMATSGWAKEMNAAEILAEPTKFAGTTVTLKGAFIYSEPMRESRCFIGIWRKVTETLSCCWQKTPTYP